MTADSATHLFRFSSQQQEPEKKEVEKTATWELPFIGVLATFALAAGVGGSMYWRTTSTHVRTRAYAIAGPEAEADGTDTEAGMQLVEGDESYPTE
jgi:hypothetical protein